MSEVTVAVPDIGGAENVDVIEVCVAVGDTVEVEQSLIVLETDKATVDVPSTARGRVIDLKVKEGDKVSQGSAIVVLDVESAETPQAPSPAGGEEQADTDEQQADTDEQQADTDKGRSADKPSAESSGEAAAPSGNDRGASRELQAKVPDLGTADPVDVIEVAVAEGDRVSEGDTVLVVETDKASVEVPAPASGTISRFTIKEGDRIKSGDPLLVLATEGQAEEPGEPPAQARPEDDKPSRPVPAKSAAQGSTGASELPPPPPEQPSISGVEQQHLSSSGAEIYAGPAVRAMARKLGVDLKQLSGSGPRGRIQKEDVQDYVKSRLASSGAGTAIPGVPEVDFAQFGDIELVEMSKIHRLTSANMHRSWLNVPHVTQFDEADITDLEQFRKTLKPEAERRGIKLTPVPFLLKACALALKDNPAFNRSLHADGKHFVQKHYVHIGMAVDTPRGLVVPVIRDVDSKGIWQLAEEVLAMAAKARDGKLLPQEMQGGCFTISSLGSIGGNGFTPIVNTPEVGILGVSKAQVKPLWNGSEFVPRNMLPLSLSYDHRVVNGADCGRFFTQLVSLISDIRRLAF